MINALRDALSKRGPLSTLLIVVVFGAGVFFYYADEIAGPRGFVARAPWLFDHTVLFSFLIIFVAYAAWVLGLGGGMLMVGLALAVALPHRFFEEPVLDSGMHTADIVMIGVGAMAAAVAFAKWGEEYRLREHEETRLRASENKYRALVEHSSEGIFLADADYNFLEANPRASAMLGYSRDELVGMNVRQLLVPGDSPRALPQAYQEGVGYRETSVVRKDDTVFLGQVAATVFELDGQRMVMGILRDVTEERRLQSEVQAQQQALEEGYRLHLHSLGLALTARNPYTGGHGQRVREYAVAVARRLGLPEERIAVMGIAAELHDYGKIGISDAILLKPGALTPPEWAEIRRHPELSVSLIEHIPFLREAIPIIRAHHEKMDGSGYPDGLRGESIPMEARIIGVVDAYDALTTERSYRPAYSHEEALAILRQETGGKWDPQVVQAFFQSMEDWVAPRAGEPQRQRA